MDSSPQVTPVRGLLIIICVLLGALLATNLWDIRQEALEQERWTAQQERSEEIRRQEALEREREQERWTAQQERSEEIRAMMEIQDTLIYDLMEDYQKTAYGSSVERIAEQQLIAAEAQIIALQTIALQNRQIAELLLLPYEDLPAITIDGE